MWEQHTLNIILCRCVSLSERADVRCDREAVMWTQNTKRYTHLKLRNSVALQEC